MQIAATILVLPLVLDYSHANLSLSIFPCKWQWESPTHWSHLHISRNNFRWSLDRAPAFPILDKSSRQREIRGADPSQICRFAIQHTKYCIFRWVKLIFLEGRPLYLKSPYYVRRPLSLTHTPALTREHDMIAKILARQDVQLQCYTAQ